MLHIFGAATYGGDTVSTGMGDSYGVSDLSEEGRKSETLDKDELLYTIMIRQPEFVTKEVFDRAFQTVSQKKAQEILEKLKFESIREGLCVQMLHIGSYDNEVESFEIMKDFTVNNDLERLSLRHREIYLSDFRKVAAEKLKTVLRYNVRTIPQTIE